MKEITDLVLCSWGSGWGQYWEKGRKGKEAGGIRSRVEKDRIEKGNLSSYASRLFSQKVCKVCYNLCYSYSYKGNTFRRHIKPPSRLVPKGIFHNNASLCQTATVENAIYDASIHP